MIFYGDEDSSPFNFKTWSITAEGPATASGTQTSNSRYSIKTSKGAKDISDGIEGDINSPDKFRWNISLVISPVPGECAYYM